MCWDTLFGAHYPIFSWKKGQQENCLRPTRFHQVEKATELEINGRGHRKSRKETRDALYCNRRLKHFTV
jgi:hypothetical protein